MPIPTRSQSVSRRTESGIPTRQPSVRPKGQTPAKTDGASNITVTKSRPIPKDKNEQLSSVPSLQANRGLPKYAASHTRSSSTTNGSIPSARASSTTLAKHPTTDVKRPNILTQPKALAPSNSLARTHTRSISTAAVGKGIAPVSKLTAPKTDTTAQTRGIAARKHPVESTVPDANRSSASPSQHPWLRDELLQLQLVYADSSHNLSIAQNSIAKTIHRDTEKVLHDQASVLQLESSINEAKSSLALRHWLGEVSAQSEEQKIQDLSMAFSRVEEYLNEPDSLAPLQTFDSWQTEATLLMDSRNSVAHADLQFATPLGSAWRKQMAELKQQLSLCQAAITIHGSVPDESGLGMAINKSTQFLRTLLLQIDTALSIEHSITQAESTWKKRELEKVLIRSSTRNPSSSRLGTWTE